MVQVQVRGPLVLVQVQVRDDTMIAHGYGTCSD